MLTRNLKRCSILRKGLALSTAAEPAEKFDIFRTKETSPENHSVQHIGKFYTIEPATKKQIFGHGGIPKSFEKQLKTFGESCLMVREPAVELMFYLKNTDFQQPAKRYVIYGDNGAGKSLTLAHLLHYGHQQGFVLLHVPWAAIWFKNPKERVTLPGDEAMMDLPFDAAAWLVHFKSQNTELLGKLDLRTSKDYVWSKRETTPAGATFLELVEHGIARIKFATGTIAALISELKIASTAGKCKTLVAIDGFNAFFHQNTRILGENKVKITPDKITLTKPFLDATNYDWTNGAIILTVDKIASTEEAQDSYLPRYLLGKEGFEHLDPFIPIKVNNYDDRELESCITYYVNRRWIQNCAEGFDQELKYMSGHNPYKLMNLCAPL